MPYNQSRVQTSASTVLGLSLLRYASSTLPPTLKEASEATVEMGTAKTYNMVVLGALLIQKRKKLSDRKLLKEIIENPYLQYFIGLKSFTKEAPFTAPALVYFRKRLSAKELNEINDDYLEMEVSTPEHSEENESSRAKAANIGNENGNKGTMIMM